MLEYELPEYTSEIDILTNINKDFLAALFFCINDTGRDSKFWDNHLLSYISQDIIQSCFSIYWLAKEGVTNPCKRELRFLLEIIIKQCYIEQQLPLASVTEKLDQYSNLINSST